MAYFDDTNSLLSVFETDSKGQLYTFRLQRADSETRGCFLRARSRDVDPDDRAIFVTKVTGVDVSEMVCSFIQQARERKVLEEDDLTYLEEMLRRYKKDPFSEFVSLFRESAGRISLKLDELDEKIMRTDRMIDRNQARIQELEKMALTL